MKYLFKGNLAGFLCTDYKEAIGHNKVLLYAAAEPDQAIEKAVANTKDTFRLVSDKELADRRKLLIKTVETDAEGNFEFELDEKQSRQAFDIDFICGTVSHSIPVKPPKKAPQFHLTTLYPEWRSNKDQSSYFFRWDYIIPAKWWCYIRGHYFDAWTILGHMYICDTKTPLPGIQVTAMDADFLTDDNLGSDVTDANGFFRIDYTSADFKRTFLSPLLNIETDPSFLSFVSGPDVYFTYAYNGSAIQGETRANRRNNVSFCLCVNLCLKDFKAPETTIPASFTKIGNNGNHYINETVGSGSTNVIAHSTGKTAASQAFFSYISLRGNLSKKLNNMPLEYSFETIETTGPGTAANTAIETGTWKKVTAAQLGHAEIGNYITATPWDLLNPITEIPYVVNSSTGMDASGWIAVPQAGDFFPNTNGQLLVFNTGSLNAATVSMDGLIQGQSVTTKAPLQQNRFFKIRMIKRQAGNPLTEVIAGVSNAIAMFNTKYEDMPKHGSWMPKKATEYGVACLDIQEMIGGGGSTGCTPIIDAIHVNYTAANPNMGAVRLELFGPGGPYTMQNVAPAGNVAETHGTATTLVSQATGLPVSITSLSKCAYTVILTAPLKMTNGESQHSDIDDWLSFCKG